MKNYYYNRQNKGITLIALVVTIIVLLILAGVSISYLTGQSGLLSRSNEAKSKNIEATVDEHVRLAVGALRLNIATSAATDPHYDAKKNMGTLKNALEEDLHNYSSNYTVTATPSGNSDSAVAEANFKIEYNGTDYSKAKNDPQAKIIYTVRVNQQTLDFVKGQAVTGISASAVSVEVGETKTIAITTTPNTGIVEDLTYTYSSSDETKATVDEAGVITGVAAGSATITITASNGKTTSCTVTVTPQVAKFKTVTNATTGEKKVYYYTGSEPQPGTSTTTEITKANMGDYLGMKVNYRPDGTLKTTDNKEIGRSTTYRLFYIDIATDAHPSGNYYGDGYGTIYLKADVDISSHNLNYLPNVGSTDVFVTDNYNKLWAANATYSAEPRKFNATYVNRLLDKNMWDVYKDDGETSAGIANYVVGAPSLEMWVDSYNLFLEKNPPTSGTYYALNCTITQDTTNGPKGENGGYGYYIGNNNAYGYNSGYKTAYDTLVKPSSYTSTELKDRVCAWSNGWGGYWLASPSAFSNAYGGYVMAVFSESWVGNENPQNFKYFCPLVSCNSGVAISEAP